MDVLLINPPCIYHSERDIGFNEFLPHTGLAYIAGYLKYKGIRLGVIDSVAENLSFRDTRNRIPKIEGYPSLVGITASTYQIEEADHMARILKSINKDTAVVVGGFHASAIPLQTLEEFPSFDFAIFGEGEHTMFELHLALKDNRSLKNIKGLAFRKGGHILMNSPRPPIEDLDSQPMPAFEHFPLDRYRAFYTFRRRLRALTISTSRGCPYNCYFCFKTMGGVIRTRTPESVLREIERDIGIHKARQLTFTDEIFTAFPERVHSICRDIIQRGYHRQMEWICESRVDHVDYNTLELMGKANCAVISFGVESGNQEILNKCFKGIRLEQATDAVSWARKAGLRTHTSFIIGHPTETLRTIKDTMQFSIRINPDYCSYAILTPLPGTRAARMAQNGEGGLKLLSREWSKYGKQIGAALELKDLPRSVLERLQREAYRRFYLRKGKLRNVLDVVNIKAMPIYLVHSLKTLIKEKIGRKKLEVRS